MLIEIVRLFKVVVVVVDVVIDVVVVVVVFSGLIGDLKLWTLHRKVVDVARVQKSFKKEQKLDWIFCISLQRKIVFKIDFSITKE